MSQISPTNSRSPFNLTSPSSFSVRKTSAVSISSGSSGNATVTQEHRQGPARGTKAHLPPVLPCIVFFAQKANARDESGTTRSFLVVEGGYLSFCIDVKVVLITSLVAPEVSADAELLENEPGSTPSYRCVLESKGAYLPARRSREIANPDRWDLLVVGLHKRQREAEQVKRLKHVIIQFDTRDSECKTSSES